MPEKKRGMRTNGGNKRGEKEHAEQGEEERGVRDEGLTMREDRNWQKNMKIHDLFVSSVVRDNDFQITGHIAARSSPLKNHDVGVMGSIRCVFHHPGSISEGPWA